MKKLFIAILLTFLLAGSVMARSFSDDFEFYSGSTCYSGGDSIGMWDVVFAGYGCVMAEGDYMVLDPEEGGGHAALVVGPRTTAGMIYDISLYTAEQLRYEDPNYWEVGWVIWQYTDNDHFYYFIPKPNGWELGKRDPDYEGGQRFLATGSDILYPIENWYDVKIIQIANVITVYVDGVRLVRFEDTETPYMYGRIGLYTEDAEVWLDDMRGWTRKG